MDLTSLFSSNTQPQNTIDWGRDAVKFFHNEMISKYDSYTLTLDQLTNQISLRPDGTQADQSIFLDGLGTAISQIGMAESQVQQAMVKLADAGNGQIPKQSAFFKALSDRIGDITSGDWIAAAPQIAADTALTAVQGVQAIGDSVIATGKTLTMIGPALIVGAVIFIVYARARELGGR